MVHDLVKITDIIIKNKIAKDENSVLIQRYNENNQHKIVIDHNLVYFFNDEKTCNNTFTQIIDFITENFDTDIDNYIIEDVCEDYDLIILSL